MITHAPDNYKCPFCALANGWDLEGLHSSTDDIVCRNENAIGFVASHWWELNLGHVLIIPVQHFENLYELPDDIGAGISTMSRRVARAMKMSYACDGVSTRQHNEPAGYQSVWHFHLHIFPRYINDRLYPADDQKRVAWPSERRPFVAKLKAALAMDSP